MIQNFLKICSCLAIFSARHCVHTTNKQDAKEILVLLQAFYRQRPWKLREIAIKPPATTRPAANYKCAASYLLSKTIEIT